MFMYAGRNDKNVEQWTVQCMLAMLSMVLLDFLQDRHDCSVYRVQ